MDRDLQAMQQVRELLRKAKEAQTQLATFSQEKVDRIVRAMAEAGYAKSEYLARLAIEETQLGDYQSKVTKNRFATRNVYESIKDMRTVGVISWDPIRRVAEIAEPVGVICGIIPTTNPTSTTMFKSIIAMKARNAIVFSPHPRAVKCITEAAKLMHDVAVSEGAPSGCIGCLSIVVLEATQELMRHKDTSLILATGGAALVNAAYSAGKPAYGVGPGNVPAFIERSADVPRAVADIIASQTFDNGTICASEQAVIADEPIRDQVIAEFKRQSCYFVSPEEKKKLEAVVIRGDIMNPAVVGQPATRIAEMAGISVPPDTKVLLAFEEGVGPEYPLSREKLCPVLAFYTAKDWLDACDRCIELLRFGGIGHSLVIHSRNPDVIMEFAMKKPVFRILVNTPSSQGGVGFTTNLTPSLTLGCGTWGGNITSDNISPRHLLNIKRVAFGMDSEPVAFGSFSAAGRGKTSSTDEALARADRPVPHPMIWRSLSDVLPSPGPRPCGWLHGASEMTVGRRGMNEGGCPITSCPPLLRKDCCLKESETERVVTCRYQKWEQ